MPKKKRKKSTKNTKKQVRAREVSGVVIIALGILLFVSVLSAGRAGENAVGAVGAFLAMIMSVLAGTAAVMVPLALIVLGILIFAGRYRGLVSGRFFGLALLFFGTLGLLHMPLEYLPWKEYMSLAVDGVGGGVFGGALTYVSRYALGQVGSMIIFIAFLLVGFLLLTEISLKNLFVSVGSSVGRFFDILKSPETDAQYEKRIADKERSRQKKKELVLRRRSDRAAITAAKDRDSDKDKESEKPPFIIAHEERVVVPPLVEDKKRPFKREITPDDNTFSKEFLPTLGRRDKPPVEPPSIDNKVVDEDGVIIYNGTSASEPSPTEYVLPPTDMMTATVKIKNPGMNKKIEDSVEILEDTLESFGIKAKVTQVVAGPAVTRYELQPAPGVKVSRIVSLNDDIALSLAASDVRIEAPIPGRSVIGIEVPQDEISTVSFREVIESEEFKNHPSKLSFALGRDISGKVIIGDLAKMPHLLIAGATGMGKSVCLNSLICSILYKAKPDEVKFLLIDPKKVEMANYAGLPHLNSPVVTDVNKAAPSLEWVVKEMENRYEVFSSAGVRDFAGYNSHNADSPMCQIVVIIDELSDLMMVARDKIEKNICRLAQMARAAGIHIVVATQRPSVDVITGLIKANIPSRIAFAVSSGTDSRTILDFTGAERLIGRGDMLYYPTGMPKPVRVQGTFISEKDIQTLTEYCRNQRSPDYNTTIEAAQASMDKISSASEANGDRDSFFYEAAKLVIDTGQASTSYLQRRLSIGNPRAARLMDTLEEYGIVGGPDGSKPRKVLMTVDEFEETYGIQ